MKKNYSKSKGNCSGAMKVAKKALKLVKENGPELKRYLNQIPPVTVTYTGGVTPLTNLAEGLDSYERIGKQITLKGMLYDDCAVINGTGASSMVRTIIFIDKSCVGGATPAASDVLQFVGALDAVNSPYNASNRARFKILHDKVSVLNIGVTLASHTKKYIRLGHKQYYTGVGSGAFDKGTVFLLIVSDVTGGTNIPSYVADYEIDYIDC